MLNIIFLVHSLLAFAVAALAIINPDLLVQIATFSGVPKLTPEGELMTRYFGVCLLFVGAVAWAARVSSSAPARRMVTLQMLLHLLLALLVAVILLIFGNPFFDTLILIIVLTLLLFVAYAYIWLFARHEF